MAPRTVVAADVVGRLVFIRAAPCSLVQRPNLNGAGTTRLHLTPLTPLIPLTTLDTPAASDTPQIYDPDLVPPLVATIRVLIGAKQRHDRGSHERRQSEAIIAATVRNPATLRLFQDTCGTSHTSVDHESPTREPSETPDS